jgi:putative Ca2+/H+ antiporter (TMEM165/GDT1 family)
MDLKTLVSALDLKLLVSTFGLVFLAELGDKTQLATLLFATDRQHHPVAVFVAAASALVISTAVAVLIGTNGSRYLETVPLKPIAAVCFIAMGCWMLIEYVRAG